MKILRCLSALVVMCCLSGCITTAYTVYQAANSPLTLSQQIDDKTIHAKAVMVLNGYPGLTHTKEIQILVFNRQLLIVGEVPSQKIRRGLVKQLSKVPDVVKIFNRLSIGSNYSEDDARSDFLLELKVKAGFMHFEHLNRHHYPLVVYRHTVYVLGYGQRHDKKMVSEIISKVKGVKQVVTFF